MALTNKHGLSRDIPAKIRREVRQRCKFGCVICRKGLYQFEHIDPPFEDANEHSVDDICALCGGCHEEVTRGHLSKAAVRAAYQRIQNQPLEETIRPVGPLDFHDGSAELSIGELLYSPAVRSVVRYHGVDIIQVSPSLSAGEPGTISAIFTDDDGTETLRLDENAWIGSLTPWDIEVLGNEITVRRKLGQIVLQLRLEPPGRIIITRLDMRVYDAHILVGGGTYAVGRYLTDGTVHWVHAYVQIYGSTANGTAIEFTEPEALERRDQFYRMKGKELATDDRNIVINSNAGVLIKPIGVAIAGLCGSFALVQLAVGNQPLQEMRRVMIKRPSEICRFISTGKIGEEVRLING